VGALAFVVRRILLGLVLLWVLSLVTFFLFFKIPADPAGFLVDPQKATPEQRAQARHQLGVDRPVHVQYAKYVWRALHGDFGTSWPTISFGASDSGRPVGPMVWHAMLVTGSLVLGGVVLLLLLAVPLGALAATRPRSWLDRAAIAASLAAVSTHPLVVGLLLQLFVGNRWHLTPATRYCTFLPPSAAEKAAALHARTEICGGPGPWASHLVLPWITFALFFVALYMRMVRAQMLDVLEQQYVRTARAKGASELRVVRSHALRNMIGPIVTMLGMDVGMAVGIALYIETVFALPGLGRTTIAALAGNQGFDLPVILGVTLVVAAAIIVLNLLADLVLLALDPRISDGGRRGSIVVRLV
jgi:peptide/nickel transport system permease protein